MSWKSRKASKPRKKKSKKMSPEQIEARNKKVDKAANEAAIVSDLAWGGRILAAGLDPVGIAIGGGMIAARVIPMLKKKAPEEDEVAKRKPRGSPGETV